MTPEQWMERYDSGFDLSLDETAAFLGDAAEHLRAALAEISRLRAQLEGAVVPEFRAHDMALATEWMSEEDLDHAKTAANITAWIREKIHSVPASRVLRDGEVAVDAKRLETLIEQSSTLLDCVIMNHWKGPLVDDVGKALAALRSQEGGA